MTDWVYFQLRETLTQLSWTADRQIAWLNGRLPVDELALDYDGIYPAIWSLREAGWISPELDAVLAEINRLLTVLTDEGDDAWTEEALKANPRWAETRRLASHARALMVNAESSRAAPHASPGPPPPADPPPSRTDPP
ncbi:hypothetical protein FDA94_03225 [Herbidospora galbida]|uniref:Uncharacterized protein n=1 Tax=Herbidospora galbida TaxID=2575442 RepID=A0A4U3MPV6_9ACTN|nr:hypothetical protein [Herbidospora galbida]TKK90792.1 hypothetical protein FDA94_03225 [Herbidospora galbida]